MGQILYSTIMASKLLQSLQILYKQLYRECLHPTDLGQLLALCTIQQVLSRLVIENPPNLKYGLWGRDLSLGVYL